MRTFTLLLLLTAVAGRASGKDMALQQHVVGRGNTVLTYERTEYLTPSLYAVDGPYSRTVIDAKARTVLVLDKEEHTYWQVSFDSLRRETDEIASGKHLPESKDRDPVTLKATGITETIAGYPAAEYTLEGGEPKGSAWLAKDLESPADPALWKDWTGLGARLGSDGKLAEAIRAEKRVALRTTTQRSALGTLVTVTAETTAVREESPPPDLGKVPDGYTRASRHSLSR